MKELYSIGCKVFVVCILRVRGGWKGDEQGGIGEEVKD
jgi:hypothetical protein